MCDVRVCHFVRAFGTRSVWVDSFISTNYVALTQQADRTNPEESDTRWYDKGDRHTTRAGWRRSTPSNTPEY